MLRSGGGRVIVWDLLPPPEVGFDWTSIGTLLGARRGEPEDVAEAVRFLYSPASRWVTGATIRVHGGLHLGFYNEEVQEAMTR